MGLFYEVAKGVMKKPRSVARRTLAKVEGLSTGVRPMRGKRYAGQMAWEDYVEPSEGAARTVERESGYKAKGALYGDRPKGQRREYTDWDTGEEPIGDSWFSGSEPRTYAREPSKVRKEIEMSRMNQIIPEGERVHPERRGLRGDVTAARSEAARVKNRDLISEPVDFRSNLKEGGTHGVWEEPKPVKRHLNLTKEQMARFLERRVLAQQQPSGAQREALNPETRQFQMFDEPMANEKAMNTMQGFQPPDRSYARLQKPVLRGGEQAYQNQDMPYAEAMIRLLKDSPQRGGQGMLRASDEYVPPVNAMSLGENPSFERRVFKPLAKPLREGEQRAKEVTKEMSEEFSSPPGETVQQNLDARTKRALAKAQKYAPQMSIEEMTKNNIFLENLWRQIGGKRGYVGREWERFRAKSKGKNKVADSKDYFIRVGLKWMADPEAAAKVYPQESVALEELWKIVQQGE